MVDTITAERLSALQDGDDDYALVDTRPREDYEAWHVSGAVNYPYNPDDEPDEEDVAELRDLLDGHDRVVTICAKGISSHDFAELLAERGVADEVTVVDDGMEGWSRVYDVARVPLDADDVVVSQVQRRAKGCLGYVVGD
ncbi:rhodanese-like domain-containing protein, partial [Halobium palmae]